MNLAYCYAVEHAGVLIGYVYKPRRGAGERDTWAFRNDLYSWYGASRTRGEAVAALRELWERMYNTGSVFAKIEWKE